MRMLLFERMEVAPSWHFVEEVQPLPVEALATGNPVLFRLKISSTVDSWAISYQETSNHLHPPSVLVAPLPGIETREYDPVFWKHPASTVHSLDAVAVAVLDLALVEVGNLIVD